MTYKKECQIGFIFIFSFCPFFFFYRWLLSLAMTTLSSVCALTAVESSWSLVDQIPQLEFGLKIVFHDMIMIKKWHYIGCILLYYLSEVALLWKRIKETWNSNVLNDISLQTLMSFHLGPFLFYFAKPTSLCRIYKIYYLFIYSWIKVVYAY